jgi:hypothetical protein
MQDYTFDFYWCPYILGQTAHNIVNAEAPGAEFVQRRAWHPAPRGVTGQSSLLAFLGGLR